MMNRIFLVNSDHNRRMEDPWRILTAVFRIWNHQPMYTAEIAAHATGHTFFPCESCEQIVLRPRLEKPDLPIYQWVGPKGNTNRFPYFPIMFSYENILELVSTLKNGQLVETPTTTTIEIRSKTRYFSLKSWWKHTCSPLFHTFSIYRQGMIGPTGAPPFRPPHGTARPQRRRDRERRWDRERFRSRDLRGLLRGLFLAAGWWVNQQNMGWQKNNARMGEMVI